MSKNLGVSIDYILDNMSYENLIMYGYSTPSPENSKKDDDWDDSLDANNPDNFSGDNEEEEEFVV